MCLGLDKKILIPLTSSLYVPGKIKDTVNVLMDVGTGYFVEKVGSGLFKTVVRAPSADSTRHCRPQSTKAAKASYNQKQLALRSSLATLQSQIEQKQNNFQSTTEMLRAKLSAAAAAGGSGDQATA